MKSNNIGSSYILVSDDAANKLREFSPTTHNLLLEGSTIFCIMKVALTVLILGLPLVLALSWDGIVALKNKIVSFFNQQDANLSGRLNFHARVGGQR